MSPPSLPSSPLRDYLRFAAWLLVPWLLWMFSVLVLHPRLEMVQQHHGAAFPRLEAIAMLSRFLVQYFWWLVLLPAALLLLAEWRWPAWPRYRWPVLSCLAWLTFTAVALQLASIATVALLLALPRT
jgi:hypothetical protein